MFRTIPVSTMLILRGSPALSPFRVQKLLSDLTAAGLPVRSLSAEFVHVAETTADLAPDERNVLEKLLTYGPRRTATEVEGLLEVVAPRPGTISPWSSKATDIAHICGLNKIKRIERVVAYTIDLGAAGKGTNFPFSPLGPEQSQILRAKLHDRMTQVVFGDLAACAALFRHETPRPLSRQRCA